MSKATLDALFKDLPPVWATDLLPSIRHEVTQSGRKVIVLDDDPTGTQTVYDVPVLTEWSHETLQRELSGDARIIYLLTNSRSLPLESAEALNSEIGERLREVSDVLPFVVSRGDSTLRGHYPGEVEALARALGEPYDGVLLAPFFLEGGRYTLQDTHYAQEDDALVPVGETDFARDTAFGFASSDLKAWVAEKTAGRVPVEQVASLPLTDIREGGPDAITERLLGLSGRTVVVNAASRRDLEVVALAALRAEAAGKRFLYRTAASFVQVLAGLEPRAPLSAADLVHDLAEKASGGLIVVGSHVPKSTRQLGHLLERGGVRSVEVRVPPLLEEASRRREVSRASHVAEEGLAAGETVVVYTQRELLTPDETGHDLSSFEIGQRVSASLVQIVRSVTVRPRFLIAKGGITSSDLATHGLGVERALVRGQLLLGVPVWTLGQESRFPGLSYVVFPGNVGDDAALARVAQKLSENA